MLEEKKANTKEELILKAAEDVFMEKGYDGAKTTAIAQKAGVTHAMLHYYFRTKENLFNRVLNEKIGMMLESIITSFTQPSASLWERIEGGLNAHFNFLSQNPAIPRFVVNELISNPDRQKIFENRLKSIFPTVSYALQNDIDKNVESGIMNPIEASDLIIDIVSLNVFIFISFPLIKEVLVASYGSEEEFFKRRRAENILTMKKRLMRE